MDLFLSAPPLSRVALVFCAAVTGYSWALALYAFRPTTHAEALRSARRVKRIVIAAAVIAVLAYVIGCLQVFAEIAGVEPERKAALLGRGLDNLLVRPALGTVVAGLLALTLLRARASYLKPDEPARPDRQSPSA